MVNAVGTESVANPRTNVDVQKKRLKEACQDFEAVMTNFVFKSMQATVTKADKSSDPGMDVFEGMLNETLATASSRHDRLGLSDALYKQLASGIDKKQKTDQTASASGIGNGNTGETLSKLKNIPGSSDK